MMLINVPHEEQNEANDNGDAGESGNPSSHSHPFCSNQSATLILVAASMQIARRGKRHKAPHDQTTISAR
jgi:hypothetical protein